MVYAAGANFYCQFLRKYCYIIFNTTIFVAIGTIYIASQRKLSTIFSLVGFLALSAIKNVELNRKQTADSKALKALVLGLYQILNVYACIYL